MKNNLISTLFLVILSLLCTRVCFAEDVFSTNFTESDLLEKWNIVPESDKVVWNIVDNSLVSIVRSGESSVAYARMTGQNKNSLIEIDAMNSSGVDMPIYFKVSEDKKSYYQVGYRYYDSQWTQDCNNITLFRKNNGVYTLLDIYPNLTVPRKFDLSKNVRHKIKILLINRNIKIYFDDELAIDYEDNSADFLSTGGIALSSWGGNYPGETVNQYYSVKVSSVNESVQTKTIILPGLGASWNTEAMVFNKLVPDDQWKMTPFASNYDGLISSFKAMGLEQGRDFFVWNYDWRKPVSEIANKLDIFINQKVGENEKINLVGHSLGGLVARIWAQNNLDDKRVGKVITLGSPHFGAIDAYSAWEGAVISDKPSLSSVALSVVLQLQKKNYGSDLQTIRSFTPVIKDLIPVFDYLKRKNVVVPAKDMLVQNGYLSTENSKISPLLDRFTAIAGNGSVTKSWVNVKSRNAVDELLNYWPDGKPTSFVYEDGDGTVLRKSAIFPSDMYIEFSSKHGELPTRSIKNIFLELGMGTAPDTTVTGDLDNYNIFFIGSPVKMRVRCGLDWVDADDMGFVVLKTGDRSCEISLLGIENGTYHLVTGNTSKQYSWKYLENEVKMGEVVKWIVDAQGGWANKINYANLLDAIDRDMGLLCVKGWSMHCHDKNRNPLAILEKIIKVRRASKDIVITNRLLSNLEPILTNESKKEDEKSVGMKIKKAEDYVELMDKLLSSSMTKYFKLTNFEANNYSDAVKYIESARQCFDDGQYGPALAKIKIGGSLLSLVTF